MAETGGTTGNAAELWDMMKNLDANELTKGKRAGDAQAAKDGCGYWKENPDAVLELRQPVGDIRSGPRYPYVTPAV